MISSFLNLGTSSTKIDRIMDGQTSDEQVKKSQYAGAAVEVQVLLILECCCWCAGSQFTGCAFIC